MRPNGRYTFENFWTNKNSHFGPKHDDFGPKFGFLLTRTKYIEPWWHMIAQNDPLDEYKNSAIQNFFGPPKKMALGVRKWPFLAKNFKFCTKKAIFSGPKIFKKFFFVFFYISDHFLMCLMKTKFF